MIHAMTIRRTSWQQWAAWVREQGDEAAQCPLCGLWCVARAGQDPLLDGLAQVVLDTREGYPRAYLGPAQHQACPAVLLGVLTAEQALTADPEARQMLPAMPLEDHHG